jgi:cystathionine beta-lyase/cystathionine gamma-synthase
MSFASRPGQGGGTGGRPSPVPLEVQSRLNRLLYGCSFKHFRQVDERLKIKLMIADLSDRAALVGVEGPIHMVFFETPTNPFSPALDIAEAAGAVKARHPDALIVV